MVKNRSSDSLVREVACSCCLSFQGYIWVVRQLTPPPHLQSALRDKTYARYRFTCVDAVSVTCHPAAFSLTSPVIIVLRLVLLLLVIEPRGSSPQGNAIGMPSLNLQSQDGQNGPPTTTLIAHVCEFPPWYRLR